MELLLGDIASSLKKNLGIRAYDNDRAANLNIGAMKFDVLCNKYGTADPATGDGLDGTVIHEAYLTNAGTNLLGLGGDVLTQASAGATTIAMSTGTFANDIWVIANTEKMWVTNWNPVTSIFTVVRGQLGTTASLIKAGSPIYTLGDTLNEGVYSKSFYNAAGYWTAIKCISGDSASGVVDGVRMQANNLSGDNITTHSGNDYDPQMQGGSVADYYLIMSPGDIIYGKFNRVCIDEAVTGTDDAASKLILYKG